MPSVNNNGSAYGSIASYPSGDSTLRYWVKGLMPSGAAVFHASAGTNPNTDFGIYDGTLFLISSLSGYTFVFPFQGEPVTSIVGDWLHIIQTYESATSTHRWYVRRQAETTYRLSHTATGGPHIALSLFRKTGAVVDSASMYNVWVSSALHSTSDIYDESLGDTPLDAGTTLWAAYCQGPTPDPSTWGQDASGNGRHL